MQMPFGKHRGWDLEDIPDSYLAWVLRNCENLRPNLKEAIVTEVEDRKRRGPDAEKVRKEREQQRYDDQKVAEEAKARAAEDQRRQERAHEEWRRRHFEERSDSSLVHSGVAAWRQNWRKIIFRAHPDRGGDEELCKILVGINELMNRKL